MGIRINKERCIVCGHCVEICPEDILVFADGFIEVKYLNECAWCGSCQIDCPQQAILVEFDEKVGPVFIRKEEPQ